MTDGDSVENKRKFERQVTHCTAETVAGERVVKCHVMDISAGGARIRVEESLESGEDINLSVERLGNFIGTVRWQRGEFAGIRFAEPVEDIAAIIEGMAAQAPE